MYNQFDDCEELVTVDLVGGMIHKTVSYIFSLKSWRNEITEEINRFNHILPNITAARKTEVIYRNGFSIGFTPNRTLQS